MTKLVDRFLTSDGVKKLCRKLGRRVDVLLNLGFVKTKRGGTTKKYRNYNVVLTKKGIRELRRKKC